MSDDGGDVTGAGGHPAYPDLLGAAHTTLWMWTAPDPEQDGLREEFLDHLVADPGALSKHGPPAHLTASCLVVDADGDHVLLTHHRRARAWFQLGGHLEPGDASLRDAAAREAAEESGIAGLVLTAEPVHLERHPLVGDFGTCREHLDVRYAARAPRGACPRVGAESLDVRWWPVDALPAPAGEELGPLVAAALAALSLTRPGR